MHENEYKPELLDALFMGNGRWAVRPINQIGTCGFHPWPWTVTYVKAADAKSAVKKAVRWHKKISGYKGA